MGWRWIQISRMRALRRRVDFGSKGNLWMDFAKLLFTLLYSLSSKSGNVQKI
jgi:hypothetical protein